MSSPGSLSPAAAPDEVAAPKTPSKKVRLELQAAEAAKLAVAAVAGARGQRAGPGSYVGLVDEGSEAKVQSLVFNVERTLAANQRAAKAELAREGWTLDSEDEGSEAKVQSLVFNV